MAEIARAIGCDVKTVRRVVGPDHTRRRMKQLTEFRRLALFTCELPPQAEQTSLPHALSRLSVAESAWEVVMGMREVSCLPALLVDQGLDFREAQPDFSVDLSDAGLGRVLHVGSPKRLVTKPL